MVIAVVMLCMGSMVFSLDLADILRSRHRQNYVPMKRNYDGTY